MLKQCNSKHHVGNRLIPVSEFGLTTRKNISNRCKNCAAIQSALYTTSEKGKKVKQLRYQNNRTEYLIQSKQYHKNLPRDATYFWKNAKRRAKRYNIDFTITESDIIIPEKCPVFDIPLFISDMRTDNTPSLDRIDNNKGYIPGNVCVISWKANRLKGDLSLTDITLLYQYMKQFLED